MPICSLQLEFFLYAVKLQHGTDGFTSPPKEGVLRVFRPKNPTASAGCELANLGTKGQHATSRPPKPLCCLMVLLKSPTCNVNVWIFKRTSIQANANHSAADLAVEHSNYVVM
jgi:hypothetical protein